MSYRIASMQSFGGLNLQAGPKAVGPDEAVDLLNVEFSELGVVRQRDGYGELTVAELTNRADSISPFYKSDGTRRLVVGNGNRLTAIGTDGVVTGSQSTAPTANPHFFSRFGGPTIEALYIANGTDQVRRYDTAGGFTTPAGLSGQLGRFLCVQSPDNRLVVARESGTTAGNNVSSVNFSNAGAPETFTASDYVDITPGDGEAIMGVCAWREFVFVFKETKFAVFYGNTTSGGVTTFNYRLVDGGVGLASSRALAVTGEGVYFFGRRGIYRTVGGPAQLLSETLEPFFQGRVPSVYYQSSTLAHASITASVMFAFRDRVYVAVPTGSSTTNDRILVYDPHGEWWSMYDIPASCGTPFRVSTGEEELVFGYATGEKHLGRHGLSTYTADDMEPAATGGSAITSRWRSGWQDFGVPEEKTVRESQVWGSGELTVSLTSDYKQAGGLSEVVEFTFSEAEWDDGTIWDSGAAWGPTSTIAEQLVRQSIPGVVISTAFSNSTINETWAIHRLAHHLRELREPTAVNA